VKLSEAARCAKRRKWHSKWIPGDDGKSEIKSKKGEAHREIREIAEEKRRKDRQKKSRKTTTKKNVVNCRGKSFNMMKDRVLRVFLNNRKKGRGYSGEFFPTDPKKRGGQNGLVNWQNR